jgi:NO-binding membrane sensor protein with MHYT domain
LQHTRLSNGQPRCAAFRGGLTAGEILYEYYDYRLVTLSILFSVLAAHVALDLASRVKAARDRLRVVWLCGGAVAMGLGMWSMHYIGMLAFSLRIPVLYHYPTVILSLLAAIVASAVALFTISREEMNAKTWVVGSLMMGGGIVAMHFIGMAAMRMAATTEYVPWNFALAVVWALAGSLIALRLAFQAGREEKPTTKRKLISALIMGGANRADALHGHVVSGFSGIAGLARFHQFAEYFLSGGCRNQRGDDYGAADGDRNFLSRPVYSGAAAGDCGSARGRNFLSHIGADDSRDCVDSE